MKVGFTGTRDGLTAPQYRSLARLLSRLAPTEAHVGCAVGADEACAVMLLPTGCRVVGHPSDLRGMTSGDACAACDEVHQPLPPLERNRRIVDAAEVLVACPAEDGERLRSGTWATVREARRRGKPVFLVLPSGEVAEEKGTR